MDEDANDSQKRFHLSGPLSIDLVSQQLIDSNGRIRIFHGVNFVCKAPPWYWPQLLEDSFARDLNSWGLNIVRLGVMWSGLEPVEGRYDQEYLEVLRKIIRNFATHGVSVILDLHQDVASSKFGTYDGFPPWLLHKLRQPGDRSFPWPLKSVESWFLGYLTLEVNSFYQALYENKHGSADSLARAWSVVARDLGGEPGVIGYELLNEPWSGDTFSDGRLLLPGQSGRRLLSLFYNRLHSAIRREDKEGLVIWEAVTWAHWLPIEGHLFSSLLSYLLKKFPLLSWLRLLSWLGLVHLAQGRDTPEKPLPDQAWVNLPEEGETKTNQAEKEMLPKDTTWVPEESFEEDPDDGWIPAFGTGFTKVPGGEDWKRKSVLSWHYYYPPLTYSTKSFPWWHRALAHWLFGPGVFLRSEKEAKKLGAASLLTEWGIARPDADKPDSWGSVEAAWVME